MCKAVDCRAFVFVKVAVIPGGCFAEIGPGDRDLRPSIVDLANDDEAIRGAFKEKSQVIECLTQFVHVGPRSSHLLTWSVWRCCRRIWSPRYLQEDPLK